MNLCQSVSELRRPGNLNELRFLKTADGITAWALEVSGAEESFESGVIRVGDQLAWVRQCLAGDRTFI